MLPLVLSTPTTFRLCLLKTTKEPLASVQSEVLGPRLKVLERQAQRLEFEALKELNVSLLAPLNPTIGNLPYLYPQVNKRGKLLIQCRIVQENLWKDSIIML